VRTNWFRRGIDERASGADSGPSSPESIGRDDLEVVVDPGPNDAARSNDPLVGTSLSEAVELELPAGTVDDSLDPLARFVVWDLLDRTAAHDVPSQLLDGVSTLEDAVGWWDVFRGQNATAISNNPSTDQQEGT